MGRAKDAVVVNTDCPLPKLWQGSGLGLQCVVGALRGLAWNVEMLVIRP
jgi:hypothetical protein